MGKFIPKEITCKKESCFANVKGVCSILTDTNFGKRKCPFYKPKKEEKKSVQRNSVKSVVL